MKFLIVIAASFVAAGAFGVTPARAADPFTCTDRTGGVNGVPGSITAVRASHHDGYDRIVFEFAPTAAGAIPAYHLTQQASAKFTKDPSGMPANLQGSAGLRAGFQNTTVGAGAPTDLQPGLPVIREAAKLGDFERVSSYGIGLSGQACFRVLELGNTRLVIDFASPGQAGIAADSSASGLVDAAAGRLPDASTNANPEKPQITPAALLVAKPQGPASGPIQELGLGVALALTVVTMCALLLLRRRLARRN